MTFAGNRLRREKYTSGPVSGGGGGPAMRVVVPLQGLVQGRGGVVLGTLIPCALVYFLQLYLKRNRGSSAALPPATPPARSTTSPAPTGGLPSSRARRAQISERAAAVAKSDEEGEGSLYYAGLRRCQEDEYDSEKNPDGIVQLGLAENRLTLDLVGKWMKEHGADVLLQNCHSEKDAELSIRGIATYQPYDGSMDLKIAVAGFMDQVMQLSAPFNPSQLVLTSGATPAVEILSFCLGDPGNAFLVPSPYYPGWDRDIKWRTGIELIPVACRSNDNFNISIAGLERSYSQAKKRGLKVRAVLISNPSNPVGNLINRETLIGILNFVMEKNIQLISDEVFAGSTYGDGKFVSTAELLSTEDVKSRVHIVYGLSKDLSIPGFRLGVIYSHNESLITAARKLARFSPVSAPIDRLLVGVLSDKRFTLEYLRENRLRLRRMFVLFSDALKQLGIECSKSSGGFYCWLDMSKFISSYSEKGEYRLWEKLLSVAKLNMTPGSSCHCIEPGWFRCCFTTLCESDIPVVVERLRRITESPRSQK